VLAGLNAGEAADVQKAAKTFLGDDKSWTLLVKPEAGGRRPSRYKKKALPPSGGRA
jgi:hypothetical protein